MAEVYRFVGGQKIEKYIAKNPRTQAALTAHARTSKAAGNRILAEHEWHGDSWVTAENGGIDRYVVLHDRGNSRWPQAGAMSIEHGREPGTNSPWGPMEGLYVLHRATRANYAVRRFKGVRIKMTMRNGGKGRIKFV